MNGKTIRILRVFSVVLVLMLVSWLQAGAQEVMLDRMEKFGDLICYPAMDDPGQYYYLPDQPALAFKNGRPQFSFLKYARTQTIGEAGTGRAEGGGIVHFLVTYGASDARIRAAEKELQASHPDAVIKGPIVYRKGSFALITSFKEENTLTTKTVAVGKAPLMEGQKTAVSIALTREGAELLWESFKSDTPDISIVFDMEFAGIREPYEATLEADWNRVSKHDRLKAGFKYAWFGADVDILFQELRQTGAVKITTKGESAVMDAIIQSANEKLLKAMFDPVTSDDLTRAAAEKGSYDSLNQAAKLLKDAAGSKGSGAKGKKKSGHLFNPSPGDRKSHFFASLFNALFPEAYAQTGTTDTAQKTDTPNGNSGDAIPAPESLQDFSEEQLREGNREKAPALLPSTSASEDYARARRLYEAARKGEFPPAETMEALEAYEMYQSEHNPTGSRASEVSGRIRLLRERLDKAFIADDSASSKGEQKASDSSEADDLDGLPNPFADGIEDTVGAKSAESTTAKTPSAGSKSADAATEKKTPATPKSTGGKKAATAAQKNRSNGSPGFSLVASYSMKRIKRSGKLVYNMNHYRTETQAFAMAENIGDIYKRYGNDDKVFRAVTIDDPVFKQREVLVTLDGQDASTFTKYLNFVTVKMRKRHQAGETTTDEIVITPESFEAASNNFSMIYGWKNDADRRAWLNYDYQAVWSFHGGVEVRTPWRQTDSPMLALAPPHRYRTVSIEGDGGALTDAEVRHAVVTFTCRIGDDYVTRQATIRNNATAPALMVDVPEDTEAPETKVDITWYLKGGRQVSADTLPLESDIVYWDELPEGGV
jgi:hypothetical protein